MIGSSRRSKDRAKHHDVPVFSPRSRSLPAEAIDLGSKVRSDAGIEGPRFLHQFDLGIILQAHSRKRRTTLALLTRPLHHPAMIALYGRSTPRAQVGPQGNQYARSPLPKLNSSTEQYIVLDDYNMGDEWYEHRPLCVHDRSKAIWD